MKMVGRRANIDLSHRLINSQMLSGPRDHPGGFPWAPIPVSLVVVALSQQVRDQIPLPKLLTLLCSRILQKPV